MLPRLVWEGVKSAREGGVPLGFCETGGGGDFLSHEGGGEIPPWNGPNVFHKEPEFICRRFAPISQKTPSSFYQFVRDNDDLQTVFFSVSGFEGKFINCVLVLSSLKAQDAFEQSFNFII